MTAFFMHVIAALLWLLAMASFAGVDRNLAKNGAGAAKGAIAVGAILSFAAFTLQVLA